MMTTTNVYMVTEADEAKIGEINATHPQGPMLIVLNYGPGPCVEAADLDDASRSEWWDALVLLNPVRVAVETTIPDL